MGYTSENDWKWSQMKKANIPMKVRYRATENQKRWDESFNDIFLPILHCYNAARYSNNKEAYFTERIQTNKKKNNGLWLWSTQFKIDFPARKLQVEK